MSDTKQFTLNGREIMINTRPFPARAFAEGYRAGQAGVDTIACPYKTESNFGVSWFAGYRNGKGKKP